MNIIKCSAGHFYDSDEFAACPHCKAFSFEKPKEELSTFRGFPYFGFEDIRMVEEIGSGTSGRVYHVQKQTDYAVRIIGWDNQETYNSALREYEIAKRLQQWSYFIHYEGCYERDNQVFLLQELATPWPKFVERKNVSILYVLQIIRILCDALSYMRSFGLLHVNVSPMNIFMKDNMVKLGGFSHVIPFKPDERYEGGSGTFPYMAPEMTTGGYCSGTEDVYSLGMTMYYMLTGGRLPFQAGEEDEDEDILLERKERDEISTMLLNSELLRIIQKAAAYHPADRYSTPEELKEVIVGFENAHYMELFEMIRQVEDDDYFRENKLYYEGMMDLPNPGSVDSHDDDGRVLI